MSAPSPDDPKFVGAVDLIGRTGTKEIQIRFSDDEEPVVWFIVAIYERDGKKGYETAASMNPVTAAFRLCAQLFDGGQCKHCMRPTGFSEEDQSMPFDSLFCWYLWDEDAKKYERGCAKGYRGKAN